MIPRSFIITLIVTKHETFLLAGVLVCPPHGGGDTLTMFYQSRPTLGVIKSGRVINKNWHNVLKSSIKLKSFGNCIVITAWGRPHWIVNIGSIQWGVFGLILDVFLGWCWSFRIKMKYRDCLSLADDQIVSSNLFLVLCLCQQSSQSG